jgi:nickel-type superoxide dismutase maturation protease
MVHYAASEGGAWLLRRRRRFRVQGLSMLPTLQPGEFVLINHHAVAASGDLVVADHPHKPIRILKRVAGFDEAGNLLLASDNRSEGSDSRHFGPVLSQAVHGVVTLCLSAPSKSLSSPR